MDLVRSFTLFLIAFLGLPLVAFSAPIRCEKIHEELSVAYYSRVASNKQYPKLRTENSSAQLMDSMAGFFENFKPKMLPMEKIFSWQKRQLSLNEKIPSKYKGLWTLHAAVEESLSNTGLNREAAHQFGLLAQRFLADAEGLSWKAYRQEMNGIFSQEIIPAQINARNESAMKSLLMTVEVERRLQVPYLAGYASDNPRKIYIDSGLKTSYVLQTGKAVDVIPFLVVHETVEKALIDLALFQDKSYLRTHQIAQQMEKALVESNGILWSEYQGMIMKREIARAEEESVRLKNAPIDIDLTPYRDYEDWATIVQMKEKGKDLDLWKSSRKFQVQQLMPGVIFLHFADQRTLARTMIRFQEHYESPQFRNQIFSRGEYQSWYRGKKGVFDYYSEWDGFNFPSYVLDAFYNKNFSNLTLEERQVLDVLQTRRHTPFYVIATADNSGANTLSHEIAHALYYLNPAYRNEVNQVLQSFDNKPVRDYLSDTVGDYHEAVLKDEVHAWLMHDTPWMTEHNFDVRPFQDITQRLQVIFKKYTE